MRAAIYARVSTRAQAISKDEDRLRQDTKGERQETSLDDQEAGCRRYCSEQNYDVVESHVYKEQFSAAYLTEREMLSALRDAVQRGEVDVVVCFAVDRLTREQNHIGIIVEDFNKAGVRLEFVTEKFEDTAVGKFLRNAMTFAAEFEREKIRDRTQRGLRARIRSGKPRPGNSAPYGYIWRDEAKSGYRLDPDTAPTVQWIFKSIAEGLSLRQVTKRLNDQGIPTPKGAKYWGASTIHTFVTNPVYAGRPMAWRTVRTKNPFGRPTMQQRPIEEQVSLPEGTAPPLVQVTMFEAIQDRMRLNRERCVRNRIDPEAALLRAGYAKCGYCGGSMVAQRSGRDGKYVAYRCGRGMESSLSCNGASMPASVLDGAAWSRVSEVLMDPTVIGQQVQQMRQNDPTEADLIRIDKLIAQADRQHARLTDHLDRLDTHSAKRIYAKLDALSAQIRGLDAEREKISLQRQAWDKAQNRFDDLQSWCRTVAAKLGDTSYKDKRLAFDALGVMVRVYKPDHEPRYVIEASIPLAENNQVVFNTR